VTTVLVAAGDASGDQYAAEFVDAFRERRPSTRFVGMGGDAMALAGVELRVHQRDLAVGGLLEVARSAYVIFRAWRRLGRALAECRPDLVVLVDSGGFNLPFARRARRISRAPLLYYVAPQVWAWRRGRIAKLAQRVDRLCVIFPFEPAFYEGTTLCVDFVGHPLVDRLSALAARLDRGKARRALGIDHGRAMVLLTPGSRRNELAQQLSLQLETAKLLHELHPELVFALALAPSLDRAPLDAARRAARLPDDLELLVIEGDSHTAIRAADVVLAKPGSVTIEAALLERPMVVMGRAHPITAAILRRVVKVPHLAMPNLIAGSQVVPELLQEDAEPRRIADAIGELLAGPARDRQLAALEGVCDRLGGGGAARRASLIAEEMIGVAPS
jgi:lipid-A-disaccharide synthase